MSTSKIQLRGHCQCCGREQAVTATEGGMAHHGYEVRDRGHGGYFSGPCSGHQHPPIEHDTTVARNVIAATREAATRHDALAQEFRDKKRLPKTIQTGARRWDASSGRQVNVEIPFEEGNEYQQYSTVRAAIQEQVSIAGSCRAFADRLEAIVKTRAGQPLIRVEITKPVAISLGERRILKDGIATVTGFRGGNVRWTRDTDQFKGATSMRTWRLFPIAPEA